MEKRGNIVLGLLVSLIIIVIVVHAGLHIVFYGTGIAGLGEKSISGLSVGPISGDTLKETLEQRFPNLSFMSKVILIVEWLALVGVLLTIFILKKAGHHQEDVSIDASIRMKTISRGKSKTDIDVLYGDFTNFRARTGWEPRYSLKETLSDLMEHWREKIPIAK